MTGTRLWPLLVSPVLLLALAACGGTDDKAAGLPSSTPQPAAASSAPPSTAPASPTPTAIRTSTVAKYGDLTLALRRPATVDAKAEIAVARFLSLHQSFAVMAARDTRPPELSRIATGDVIKTLDSLLAPQRKARERAGGTLTVRVTDAQASKMVAVVDGCFDQSRLVMIRPDGTRYVDPTVKKNPTAAVRVTVSELTGRWQVSEFSLKGKPC